MPYKSGEETKALTGAISGYGYYSSEAAFGSLDSTLNSASVSLSAFGCDLSVSTYIANHSTPYSVAGVQISLSTPYDSDSAESSADVDVPVTDGITINTREVGMAGTFAISADVENCFEITGASGSIPYAGGILEAPLKTDRRDFQRLKPGGTISITATVDGVTATASSTIPMDADVEIGQTVGAAADCYSSSGGFSKAGYAEIETGGYSLPASYAPTTTGASASSSGDCRVDTADPPGISDSYTASLSTSMSLPKPVSLDGMLKADKDDYPDELTINFVGIPGTTSQSVTGAFSASGTQQNYSAASTLNGTPQTSVGENTWSPVSCSIDPDSLEAIGENPLQTRILLHGKQFPGVTLSQAQFYQIDDCASTAGWSSGANTSISEESGAVRAVVSGGSGSLTKTGDPFFMFQSYRYIRLSLTRRSGADIPFSFTATNNGSVKTWSFDRYGNALATGADDTAVNVDIDLCQPDSTTPYDSSGDSRYPYRWRNDDGDIVDGADSIYSGVSYCDSFAITGIPDGATIDINNIELRRIGATADVDGSTTFDCLPTWYPSKMRGSIGGDYVIQEYPLHEREDHTNDVGSDFHYYVRGAFLGSTDGRQSLEETDFSYTRVDGAGGSTSWVAVIPSIADFVSRVETTLSGPPVDPTLSLAPTTGPPLFPGWSATDETPPPGGTMPDYPGEEWYYCSLGPATWLGAQGVYWQAAEGETPAGWAPALDMALGVIPAVPLYDSVDWFPGLTDPFGYGGDSPTAGTVYLRCARLLRASAHGLTLGTDHKSAAGVNVDIERDSDDVDEGGGTSAANGGYVTGTPHAWGYTAEELGIDHPGSGDLTYTPANHRVRANRSPTPVATIGMYARHRHRVAFLITKGDRWMALEITPINRIYRAFVRGSNIWFGSSDISNLSTFTDRDSGIAGDRPALALDYAGGVSRVWMVYEDGGAVKRAYTTDEGRTWSMAETVFASGVTWPDVDITPMGDQYHYGYASGAIKGKAISRNGNVMIDEFAAVASGVDDDAISARIGYKAGQLLVVLSYRSSGAVVTKIGPGGKDFV